MLLVFLKALGIGVAVAAPVGPMSVLCMRRTLTKGWRFGFGTGLGIATGDGIYALVAVLGLAGVATFMLEYNRPLHLIAGAFLLYLALRAFLEHQETLGQGECAAGSAGAAYGSGVLLTLTNPPTVVSFAAIFTVLSPTTGFDLRTAALTIAGVFIGSSLWWLALTLAVGSLHAVIGSRSRRVLHGVSTGLLGFMGMSKSVAPYSR